MSGWQDCWTFRVVDQDTGAAVPGVPVSVLETGDRSGGYWVSDSDGLVRIPKNDLRRLRLRVGLRNEEAIEFDARSLPDETIPLAAPRDHSVAPSPVAPPPPAPSAPPVSHAPAAQVQAGGGHLMRFTRIGVLPEDRDVTADPPPDSTAMRYGFVVDIELVWQSQGAQAGDTLYSISLGPGEEVRLAVTDGRWRKSPDARERPLQIVAKMVSARQIGDGMDAMPLAPLVAADLSSAAVDSVKLLAERTARTCEALRRRALGITELDGEKPSGVGTSVRTLRNTRAEGVLTYHFVEPIERHRVIVRTPRFRPALLVPFRLPNIATREVVRRFGHALRRNLLDRSLGPDIDQILGSDAVPGAERRVYAHIAAHLPYYSATIIAAGDPAERFLALAKLRDPGGRPLTDVIENIVVDRVGNYLAFPLRADFTTPEWRRALAASAAQLDRASQEFNVTLPVPGVWLRSELFPAHLATGAGSGGSDAGAEDAQAEGRPERRKRRPSQ